MTWQRLERAAQGLDLDANRGSLVAVDVNLKLRRVELEIGVDIDEARIVGGLVQHLVELFRFKTVIHTAAIAPGNRSLTDNKCDLILRAQSR